MSHRWVRIVLPETELDRMILGDQPFVIDEAPRPGAEVRLATEQEVGLFARLALGSGGSPRRSP